MNVDRGYLWFGAIALLPVGAAFLRARYFFRYPRRSQQLAMTVSALAVLFGAMWLQVLLRDGFEETMPREVWSAITIIQNALAAVTFFWKLRIEQKRLSPDEMVRLKALNARW